MDRPVPSYVRVSAQRQKTVSAIICPAQYHFSHISCRTEHKSLTRPLHSIACLNAAPGTCTLSRLSLPLPLLPDMAPSGHASSQTLPFTCDPRAGWSHHSHRLLPVIPVLAGVITVTACYQGCAVCTGRLTLATRYTGCAFISITAIYRG